MKQFQIEDPSLILDACRPCVTVWFDPREFEAVPEGVVETPDELELRGREAIGGWKVERIKEQQRREEGVSGDPPEETWKWVPALLGWPVEIDETGLARRPWLTWSLSAVIALISIGAFFGPSNIFDRFGLIPAEAWRYGGATLLTSFFLHGGVWHLIGNLYFFLLLGDNVEEYLGRWRFALLILLALLAGDCLHILGDPNSTTPCIGASGGISGVIAFYALEFPRAQLGFHPWYWMRFGWIQIPAWAWFALWILMQGIASCQQVSGFGTVSGLAHLGGAAAGFALWLWWRKVGQ